MFKTLAVVYISYVTRSRVSRWAFYLRFTSVRGHLWPYVATPSLNHSHGRSTSRAIYKLLTDVWWAFGGCLASVLRTFGECFTDVRRAIYDCPMYARRKKLYVNNRAMSEHVKPIFDVRGHTQVLYLTLWMPQDGISNLLLVKKLYFLMQYFVLSGLPNIVLQGKIAKNRLIWE